MASEEKAAKHAIRLEKQRLQLARLKTKASHGDDVSIVSEQPKRTKPRKLSKWKPFQPKTSTAEV